MSQCASNSVLTVASYTKFRITSIIVCINSKKKKIYTIIIQINYIDFNNNNFYSVFMDEDCAFSLSSIDWFLVFFSASILGGLGFGIFVGKVLSFLTGVVPVGLSSFTTSTLNSPSK